MLLSFLRISFALKIKEECIHNCTLNVLAGMKFETPKLLKKSSSVIFGSNTTFCDSESLCVSESLGASLILTVASPGTAGGRF